MSKTIQYVVMSLLAMFLISCNNPKNVEIPTDASAWQSSKFIKVLENLKDDDKAMLMAYLLKAQMGTVFGGKGLEKGLTIGEAIKLEKEFQAEQAKEELKSKALAAELQKKQLEATKVMNEAVTTSLVNLGFRQADWENGALSDYFVIQLGFKNNTGKNITGIKGVVVLKDIFDAVIKQVEISNDDGVSAGQSTVGTYTLDYNQFIDEDVKLNNTDFDKIRYSWTPVTYLFEDGSSMKMPE